MNEKQPVLTTFSVSKIISKRNNYYLKVKILSSKTILPLKNPFALVNLSSQQEINVGDRVTTWLKLKKYRSQKNVFGFDQERHAFSQRIFFKAKQVKSVLQIVKSSDTTAIEYYRAYINNIYQKSTLNWLYYALLTGDKALISYEHKQALQQFGLSHLLAISGLHISLIFSIGFFLTKSCIRVIINHVQQTVNLSLIYCIGGFILAFVYVYLSDFLVSATRALIMLGCYLLVYFNAKKTAKWRSILYALVLILLIDPFSLLNIGLYFSFFAVAIIFLIINRLSSIHRGFIALLKNLTLIQMALFLGLLPLSLYFFNGISLIGMLINLIAIPLLSFIIMPSLILFSVLSLGIDLQGVIHLFDVILSMCFELLFHIPKEYRWLTAPKISSFMVFSCYLSALIVYILPTKKFIGLLPIFIMLLDALLAPKPRWRLEVFDVGHGTMVLININNKGLVYDLGPIYFNQYTRIHSTLIPYIKSQGLVVKHTVISHQDKDHAGGLEPWLAEGYLSTFKLLQPNGPHHRCASKQFDFNGLTIKVSKNQGDLVSENDNSCVIHVSDGRFSVLLPGDISTSREHQLISQGEQLRSTILLSPHHGSNTSSSQTFIETVAPEIVIHSTAYKGLWNLPHKKVIDRYREANIEQLSTAIGGQISVIFYDQYYEIHTAREQNFWFLKD